MLLRQIAALQPSRLLVRSQATAARALSINGSRAFTPHLRLHTKVCFPLPQKSFTTVALESAALHRANVLKPVPSLGYWLLGVGGAVFGMVVLGGVTRLTRSGLSMVDWRPQGRLPPQTEAEWEEEFDKYKRFPEYQRVNRGITLEEFKEIYYMEWAHRMWGRMLGVIYVLPLAYFVASGKAQRLPGMTSKLCGLAALGGAQGLVGWWMVKSGLEENELTYVEPRVSPYRLAAHLTAATVLYTGLLWTGLTALRPNYMAEVSGAVRKLRGVFGAALAATAVTFFSGAFVAGNDAGHAYNDWPLYAGDVVPKEIWDETLKPAYRNFFENTATVQFDHRNLAYTTAVVVLSAVGYARRKPIWSSIPRAAQLSTYAMGAALVAQVTLGISTLMMFVPVPLAAMHQAGALVLLSTAVYGQHALRYVKI